MTNEMIVMTERIKLAKEGKIGYEGKALLIDGTEVDMPEEIHTFARWKAMGFCVKKGEKAITKLAIWKHTSKKVEDEDGEEHEENKMFMKTAAFFSRGQVEAVA